ncbi:MAG: AEC family transporter [Pseudomonadota bacterium]
MLEILSHLLNVVVPVAICVGIGFGITRAGVNFDTKMLTPIIMTVAMPALIVSHLAKTPISLGDVSQMMLAALLAVILFGALAGVLLRVVHLPVRTYLGAFMFANVGNMGLPIVGFAVGQNNLALAFGFWIVVVVGLLTIGTWLPQRKITFKKLIASPLIYAVLIGLGLLATGTQLPDVLDAPMTLLGGMAIPLMLLSLGHAIAELKPGKLPKGFALALAHIAIVAIVAAGVVAVLNLEGTVRQVFILEALMPVSVFTYLFAQQYSPDDVPEVASLILFSTLLTIVVVPLALAYWV